MSFTRFPLGQIVATPAALDALAATGNDPLAYIRRHVTGDWGDVEPEDANENEYSVVRFLRILSSYHLDDDTRLWIITEADRSATTLLLPEEY